MTTLPISPKLVRLWDEKKHEVASGFVHWGRGFRIDLDHPIATALRGPHHDWTITVYSTDELVWKVDNWSIHDTLPDTLRVRCIPFLEATRESLRSDDYLINLWLEAEREFYTTAVDELHRLQEENARLRESAGMWDAASNMYQRMTPGLEDRK